MIFNKNNLHFYYLIDDTIKSSTHNENIVQENVDKT